MCYGFLGLRHDVIVCCNDDDGNIRDLGTTGTHGGEGLVTGSIQEGDVAAVLERDVVGTDVLGDASCLAGYDVGVADVVQQRSLTVVHMPHDGNDGGAWNQVRLVVLYLHHGFADFGTDVFCLEAVFLGHQVDGLGIHALVDADHDAYAHAGGDNVGHRHVHHGGQLVGSNELGKLQYLVFCHLVHHLLLHLLAEGFALLTAIFGALAHLVLGREACQGFAYLLCYILLAHFCHRLLLGLVLALVLGFLSLCILLCIGVGIGGVLAALAVLASLPLVALLLLL